MNTKTTPFNYNIRFMNNIYTKKQIKETEFNIFINDIKILIINTIIKPTPIHIISAESKDSMSIEASTARVSARRDSPSTIMVSNR